VYGNRSFSVTFASIDAFWYSTAARSRFVLLARPSTRCHKRLRSIQELSELVDQNIRVIVPPDDATDEVEFLMQRLVLLLCEPRAGAGKFRRSTFSLSTAFDALGIPAWWFVRVIRVAWPDVSWSARGAFVWHL